MKPKCRQQRKDNMIQRRQLLAAFPFAFAAACVKAEAGAQSGSTMPSSVQESGWQSLFADAGASAVQWLRLSGQVRLVLGNSDPRAATLHRAIRLPSATGQASFFDVWEVAGAAPLAGVSETQGSLAAVIATNDLAASGVWVSRAFAFPTFIKPIEYSRLASSAARIMVIEENQIWLVDGGSVATMPELNAATKSAFDAWQQG